jgi:hypothetical protein
MAGLHDLSAIKLKWDSGMKVRGVSILNSEIINPES